jgi:DNA-binding winged helix-turn-helix (wHTH) protein
MSLEQSKFEFGEFSLETKEKVLRRRGEPVSLTPKALQLLLALVENHGHIVEREELMQAVWADSFVEEGNLAFTVSLLRKALGDEKQHPRFIETVPRRGYRFIAEVTEASKDNISENGAGRAVALPAAEQRDTPAPWFKKFVLPVAAAVIIGALSHGFWYAPSKSRQHNAPLLFASFISDKLSTNGKVVNAAISPDGKNVVYTSGTGRDKQSVWLRQIETGNNIQIIPPSDEFST